MTARRYQRCKLTPAGIALNPRMRGNFRGHRPTSMEDRRGWLMNSPTRSSDCYYVVWDGGKSVVQYAKCFIEPLDEWTDKDPTRRYWL